jgi:hypothetical protein
MVHNAQETRHLEREPRIHWTLVRAHQLDLTPATPL